MLVYEPSAGIIASKWKAHDGGTTAVAFAKDGRLVSGGHDAAARIWSADGKKAAEFTAILGTAFRVGFASDGLTAFAGDWSGSVRQYNAADGTEVRRFRRLDCLAAYVVCGLTLTASLPVEKFVPVPFPLAQRSFCRE